MSLSYHPRPRPSTRLAFDPSRIVIDVGVLLVLGAMSLPFVTADGLRQRAVAGDGLVALLLVLPIFLMTLLPDQSRPLPALPAWVAAGLVAVALPFSVVKYLDASTAARTLGGSVGMGSRVLVMGVFTVLTGVVLGLIRSMLRLPAADYASAPAAAPSDASAPRRSPVAAGSRGRTARRETPAARPARGSGRAPSLAAGDAPGQASTGRQFPRWRRTPSSDSHSKPARRSPAGEPAPREVPAGARPPARVAPRPRPADPDTEPTLPAQRPVQPWWPDDLEDLFS